MAFAWKVKVKFDAINVAQHDLTVDRGDITTERCVKHGGIIELHRPASLFDAGMALSCGHVAGGKRYRRNDAHTR